MSNPSKYPSSIVAIHDSLIVAFEGALESKRSQTNKDWLSAAQMSGRFLPLKTSPRPQDLLDRFQAFCSRSECRSAVICSRNICTDTNLISFHALEAGYRVFVAISELEHQVTPDVLRLTNAGASVLGRTTFEREALLFSRNGEDDA